LDFYFFVNDVIIGVGFAFFGRYIVQETELR